MRSPFLIFINLTTQKLGKFGRKARPYALFISRQIEPNLPKFTAVVEMRIFKLFTKFKRAKTLKDRFAISRKPQRLITARKRR